VGDRPVRRALRALPRGRLTAVRLAVAWSAHLSDRAQHVVDPRALDRVERAVTDALDRGLAVMVDNHLDPQLMADPPAHRERFLAITEQVAAHFRQAPESVMIEPLNEPHGRLEALWNDYLRDALTAIRASNPTRPVVAGPGFYNTPMCLDEFAPPAEERRLVVTIHQYWPIQFTMQGEQGFPGGDARAWLGTTWDGTDAEVADLETGFERLAAWAVRHKRPIFIGEFGSTNNADPASRTRWARANRELAEGYGFAWGYWSFGPSFALYDLEAEHWNEELLAALLPRRAGRYA
jgi:endoglucanase